MKILHLVFLRHAEARKFSFWPFRATRKHEKSLFNAWYVVSNSKFHFLVLDTLYVAWKFPFSCLCHCQKHFFSPFGVYVVDRSAFFLHFMFMSLSEALFFSIWCLCRWQKHFFSPFGVYVVVRSTFFSISCLLHFVLSNHGYAATIIFFLRRCNSQK